MAAVQDAGPEAEERVALSRHVVVRNFVDETVLMDVNSGRYFRLGREGGELLRAVVDAGSLSGGVALLVRAGRGQVSDLRNRGETLCEDLITRGLMVRDGRMA